MRVLITGATGTIGLALADALRSRGDQVVALSRDPERGQRVLGDGAEVHGWADPTREPPPAEALRGADGVSTYSASRSRSAGATTPSSGSATRASEHGASRPGSGELA